MRRLRRSVLSLFLCMALAVNLLVPFASASPLFVEICAGHETVLVPVPDAPDTGSCETCMVGCIGFASPEARPVPVPVTRAVSQVFESPARYRLHTILRRNARAPPLPSV